MIQLFPFLNLMGLIKKQDILLKTSGDVAGITKWMTLDVSNENEWGCGRYHKMDDIGCPVVIGLAY